MSLSLMFGFLALVIAILGGTVAIRATDKLTERMNELEKARQDDCETPQQRSCEHSWHVLVNEQQSDQRLVVTECIHCGQKNETIIGRCNHEWKLDKEVFFQSPYQQLITPVIELAVKAFQYANGTKKFQAVMDNIEHRIKSNVDEPSFFDSRIVQVRICKNCGEINTLDISQSSPASISSSSRQPIVMTQSPTAS